MTIASKSLCENTIRLRKLHQTHRSDRGYNCELHSETSPHVEDTSKHGDDTSVNCDKAERCDFVGKMRERTKASVQCTGLQDVLSTCSSLSDVADKQFVLEIDYNNPDASAVGMDVEDDGGRLSDAVGLISLPTKKVCRQLKESGNLRPDSNLLRRCTQSCAKYTSLPSESVCSQLTDITEKRFVLKDQDGYFDDLLNAEDIYRRLLELNKVECVQPASVCLYCFDEKRRDQLVDFNRYQVGDVENWVNNATPTCTAAYAPTGEAGAKTGWHAEAKPPELRPSLLVRETRAPERADYVVCNQLFAERLHNSESPYRCPNRCFFDKPSKQMTTSNDRYDDRESVDITTGNSTYNRFESGNTTADAVSVGETYQGATPACYIFAKALDKIRADRRLRDAYFERRMDDLGNHRTAIYETGKFDNIESWLYYGTLARSAQRTGEETDSETSVSSEDAIPDDELYRKYFLSTTAVSASTDNIVRNQIFQAPKLRKHQVHTGEGCFALLTSQMDRITEELDDDESNNTRTRSESNVSLFSKSIAQSLSEYQSCFGQTHQEEPILHNFNYSIADKVRDANANLRKAEATSTDNPVNDSSPIPTVTSASGCRGCGRRSNKTSAGSTIYDSVEGGCRDVERLKVTDCKFEQSGTGIRMPTPTATRLNHVATLQPVSGAFDPDNVRRFASGRREIHSV